MRPDYITVRYQSFQARVLLSELHLLDVLHFRRLIKLAERDPWQNGPELDALREALPELADRAAAEFTAAETAVKDYRRTHRGDHSPGVEAQETRLKRAATAARMKASRYQKFHEIMKEDK